MYAFSDDVKIPTTASVYRQLDKFLWPEIRKWAKHIDWKSPPPRILDTAIKSAGKEAFAVSASDASLIEGAHAKTIIYVFDEAKAIQDSLWNAAEGAFAAAGNDTDSAAYALAISTPGAPSGRFYDIHSHRAGLQDWFPIHVTLDEAISAGRVSQEWAAQRRLQWGESSAVYQNRVEGNFDSSGEDSVIPLIWVERAIERWYEAGGFGSGDESFGVDPARYGADKTAIAHLVGRVCQSIDYTSQEDTMQTAGRIAARAGRNTPIAVDVIGIGSGVFDRLRELKYAVKAVNVGESAKYANGKLITDVSGEIQFFNLRSALWWMLREALDPSSDSPLALPPDDELIGDLTAPKFSYTSAGKIRVEGKDEIRARIARSTNGADSLMLALYNGIAATASVSNMPTRWRQAKVKGRNDRGIPGEKQWWTRAKD